MSIQDAMSNKVISAAIGVIVVIFFIFLSVTTTNDLREKGLHTLVWVNVVISVLCLIAVIYSLI